MNEKILYCYICEDNRVAQEGTVTEQRNLHNVSFGVDIHHWCCSACSTIIDDEETTLQNYSRIEDEYCKSTGSISVKELKEMLVQYNMGPTTLSDLLGWGKLTVFRYAGGAIPSPEYGRSLKDLCDPIRMLKLIDTHKNRITENAARKTKNAIEKIFRNQSCYYVTNAFDVCQYFLYLCSKAENGIIPTKIWLQKLLYISQAWHLCFFNTPIFTDSICAWEHGPVVRSVWDSMKKWTSSQHTPPKKLTRLCSTIQYEFKESQIELLNTVFITYGQYQAFKLVHITHNDAVWNIHYNREDDEILPIWEIKEEYCGKRKLLGIREVKDIGKAII